MGQCFSLPCGSSTKVVEFYAPSNVLPRDRPKSRWLRRHANKVKPVPEPSRAPQQDEETPRKYHAVLLDGTFNKIITTLTGNKKKNDEKSSSSNNRSPLRSYSGETLRLSSVSTDISCREEEAHKLRQLSRRFIAMMER